MKKMMESKLKNKGGFTLVEMLIVVAIIAILISISIPLIGNALEKAREATDEANMRAAAGAITIGYLSGDVSSDTAYYYTINKSEGTLTSNNPSDVTIKYGKGTAKGADKADRAGKGIKIQISEGGSVSANWE